MRFACSGEIIVSAGAMESPRLLQRSGVGPAEWLQDAGITVVADSPGVGRHLHEHLAFAIPCRMRRHSGISRLLYGPGLLRSVLQYYLTRGGILASGPFEIGAFVNIANLDGRPDVQLFMGGFTFALGDDNHPVPLGQVDRKPGVTIYGQLLRLTSEGEIRVTSPDPGAAPRIEPNWLSTPEDRESAVAMVRYMRRYMSSPVLAEDVAHEILPGPSCQSDDEILTAFRRLATCGTHATGTCRMGADERAPLDERLPRVRGVQGGAGRGLFLDAGAGHGQHQCTAMALAWRAAQLILEDRAA